VYCSHHHDDSYQSPSRHYHRPKNHTRPNEPKVGFPPLQKRDKIKEMKDLVVKGRKIIIKEKNI